MKGGSRLKGVVPSAGAAPAAELKVKRGEGMSETQTAASRPNYCLELQGIGKSFGGLRAVNDVSLSVQPGERVAIIGPNGAGKTTLFNMISGVFAPSDGKIILNGEDVTALPNSARVYRGLARTYQITSLFWEYSILENVLIALMGTEKRKFSLLKSMRRQNDWYAEAEELLSRFGLWEKQDEIVRNLAYGDQRLLEIVLALASKPKILCLDEPNAGMSISDSKMMIDVIRSLDKDLTILLIEHDMDMVFGVVDRLMVLQDGNTVATDTKENIKKNEKVRQIYLGEA